MRNLKSLLSVICILCSLQNAFAQNRTVDKVERTADDALRMKQSADKVIGILNIGKKAKKQADSLQKATETAISGSVQGTTMLPAAMANVGTVHPAAVYVDADEIGMFYSGCAYVKKGDATGLINAAGQFILPYNKYHLSGPSSNGYQKMIYPAGEGYVSYKGKLLDGRAASEYIHSVIRMEGATCILTDLAGNKTKYPAQVFGYAENRGFVIGTSETKKSEAYAVFNNKGKQITPYKYVSFSSFSEGVAVVGITDEFGAITYGYIDSTGKEVIPFRFRNKPASFICGMAKVRPVDQSTFAAAFIDKSGKTVVTFTQSEEIQNDFDEFAGDISISADGKKYLDKQGQVHNFSEVAKRFGINSEIMVSRFHSSTDVKFDLYHTSIAQVAPYRVYYSQATRYGIVHLNLQKMIPPVFSVIQEFDAESKLAYAEFPLGKDASGREQVRKGYINEDGVFVILYKTETSIW